MISNNLLKKYFDKLNHNLYNYSKSYVTNTKKHKYLNAIICNRCGRQFTQRLDSHISGSGCKICNSKFSKCDFIIKAASIHGNKYDYNNSVYKNRSTKIIIKCNRCNTEFKQTPHKHLLGQGCPTCSKQIVRDKLKSTTHDFITKAESIHGDDYDYSRVEYHTSSTKIIIKCNKCNRFMHQTPDNHLHGFGCFECSMDKVGDLYRKTNNCFINDAMLIHGDRYNYDAVNYVNNITKVIIKCNKCDKLFLQTPSSHLSGNGCGCHTTSLGQYELYKFIKSICEPIHQNDRSIIYPNEIDIYLPDKKLGLEYHGLYWHSFDDVETPDQINYHKNKLDLCLKHNIMLLQFFEDEWLNKRHIVKNIIISKLGLCDKLYARNCKIKMIDNRTAEQFFNNNHLNGHRTAKLYYGLFYDDKLMQCLSLSSHSKYQWEIIRLASVCNISINGGFSKLLRRFILEHHPQSVITYADRRYSIGNCYLKTGFNLIGVSKPNYRYVKGSKTYSRQQFQKSKLKNKLNSFNPLLSESKNMFNNGYRRLWDAGHLKFLRIF